MSAFQGRLDVDEDRWRQEQFDLVPPPEMFGPQAAPQLGQQHVQRVSGLWGRVFSPAGHEQRVAGHWAATVEDEVGEQDPPETAGQRAPAMA